MHNTSNKYGPKLGVITHFHCLSHFESNIQAFPLLFSLRDITEVSIDFFRLRMCAVEIMQVTVPRGPVQEYIGFTYRAVHCMWESHGVCRAHNFYLLCSLEFLTVVMLIHARKETSDSSTCIQPDQVHARWACGTTINSWSVTSVAVKPMAWMSVSKVNAILASER